MLRKWLFRSAFLKLLQELKIEEPSRLKESGIGNFINFYHEGLNDYTCHKIWKKFSEKSELNKILPYIWTSEGKRENFLIRKGKISETVALHSFVKYIRI